ncbi:hypothetical protein [Streptomyces hundungensis]
MSPPALDAPAPEPLSRQARAVATFGSRNASTAASAAMAKLVNDVSASA